METPTETWDIQAAVLSKVRRLQSEGKGGLRILVTGRTGAGKSSLVNSIVGEYVAEEGDNLPYTGITKVAKYEKKVGDIEVTIYESPDLQDGFDDQEVAKLYLKDLEENCGEVDLKLYCVKMTDRMYETEETAIIKLSNSFGMDEFWRNTLIVLTFANKVKPPRSGSLTLVDHYKKRLVQWKTVLQRTLTEKAQITEEVVENVPIVPAGFSAEPSLPAAKCDYWLSELWLQSLDRTKDIAKPILLSINWERLQALKEVNIKKKGYEQPIIPWGKQAPKRVESYLRNERLR